MKNEKNSTRLRAHVIIAGRVQGVFFRASTRSKAEELALTGYVKNLPDGRVEAVFEGRPEAVRSAVSWSHKGPPYARVESVDVRWEAPQGDHDLFRVRR